MQGQPPPPTAQGSFAKTPFPHLLVYALERVLTGTFELHVGAQSVATILVIQGVPAKIRTTEQVLFLGDVMAELGLVHPDAVRASQQRMQESPRLQGQILKELGAVDDARLEAGVRAQLDRKIEHLFNLPSETIFSYYDGIDALQRYGGPPTPIDPFPPLWRGVRQMPAWEHVDATLRRVGSAAVRISPNANVDRFMFTRVEAGALDLLRQRPLRVVDLANAKVVGPSIAQLLIYVLVITKQVDLVEQPSVRPGSIPNQQVQQQMQQQPQSQPQQQAGKQTGGAAFARVQLQAKTVARSPLLVVEEAAVSRSASDGRIASPVPQAIPLGDLGNAAYAQVQAQAHAQAQAQAQGMNPPIPSAPAAPTITGFDPNDPPQDEGGGMAGMGLDIGAMISTVIGTSSMPPPMPEPQYVPPAPPSSRPGNMPSAHPSGSMQAVSPQSASNMAAAAPLTSEQSGLKQKILERAAQISSQDYFQMLGLERDATPEAVQKAFFGLAKVWHPDRLPPALVDVKDACSKVFTHLTEAQATLLDAERRTEYMTLLKDGGATPDDQAKIQAILEAATEFQKAEIILKRNDMAQALELARKAHALDPEQADYLAMVTWLESQKPEWIGREKTLEKIAVLDNCIRINANSERAYFWRGMLYKRIDESSKALKDFKKAGELNPRNLDAVREVRLFNIRGGGSKPPPGNSSSGGNSARPHQKPPQPETLGGLFGRLFKK
jgi:tetratricopeptide (TPR) repeat protein